MTSVAAQAADRTLIALISDEDTATGLLLAGIGHISTASADSNNASSSHSKPNTTQAGGGSGGGGLSAEDRNSNNAIGCHEKNFYIVNSSTPISEVEVAFNIFTKERGDIAILLITQTLAEKIRTLCDRYTQAFPALLEIPSKEAPYGESICR
jgi:V-type H+-transporting ATPase subunit F